MRPSGTVTRDVFTGVTSETIFRVLGCSRVFKKSSRVFKKKVLGQGVGKLLMLYRENDSPLSPQAINELQDSIQQS